MRTFWIQLLLFTGCAADVLVGMKIVTGADPNSESQRFGAELVMGGLGLGILLIGILKVLFNPQNFFDNWATSQGYHLENFRPRNFLEQGPPGWDIMTGRYTQYYYLTMTSVDNSSIYAWLEVITFPFQRVMRTYIVSSSVSEAQPISFKA